MEQHDPFDLRAQERATEERDLKAKLDSKTESDDFMWLLSSKRGRRIAWRLMKRAFEMSYVIGSDDPRADAFNEGRRNEANALFATMMELAPERFPEMAAEAKADARAKAKPDGARDET